MSKAKFTRIEINGADYALDGKGALHYWDANNRENCGLVASARDIDRIAVFSAHVRNAPALPNVLCGNDAFHVQDAGDGDVNVGCNTIDAADIARIAKASRKARGKK